MVASQEFSDPFLADVGKDDTLVLVFGQTGSGRSTFINRAVGSTVAAVGHRMTPETTSISYFSISHPRKRGRRFIFVDTPGFDAPGQEDWQTLHRIAGWLKKTASVKTKLVIIYLIEIDQPRGPEAAGMSPSKLLKKEINEHLVLATTKWNNLNPKNSNIGPRREDDLHRAYSRDVYRFHDTQDSAWAIIDRSQAPMVKVPQFGDKLATLLPKPRSKRGFLRDIFSSLFR